MAAACFIGGVCRSAVSGATSVFGALDRCLIALARPLGAQTGNTRFRYASFFGVYAVIYALACLPVRWLPLLALALGCLGMLAVGRAWSANENRRTQIARKLCQGNADESPDLRLLALLSAAQLPVLFPLIFQNVQDHFQLYRIPPGTNSYSVTIVIAQRGHWQSWAIPLRSGLLSKPCNIRGPRSGLLPRRRWPDTIPALGTLLNPNVGTRGRELYLSSSSPFVKGERRVTWITI